MRKNIKNYHSRQSISKTVGLIQKILARAGASRIMFEYTNSGKLESISFMIKTSRGEIPIMLPARVKKVARAMYGDKRRSLTNSQEEQVERTAWKNIQDWIDAQTAFIETEAVKLEEIFLPYMTTPTGETFFEKMEDTGFLLGEEEK
jgi:hypothetical protein|tara:strand:+ start:191 stop:631 length:441 start_codon:yes stop_codon:yes gene_type:complete